MAKHAGLPWDLILSAEVFRHYKPDPETYLGVAEIFDLEPGEVMLVAAHEDDLDAASSHRESHEKIGMIGIGLMVCVDMS
jgi:2-haloacid dehalogenase